MKKRFSGADAGITITLLLVLIIAIVPIISVIAQSFSSATAISTGQVGLWPKSFTLAAYEYSVSKPEFLRSLGVSALRVVLGCTLSLIFTVLAAYPLSRSRAQFRHGGIYTWFFVFTMFFSGGLLPTYFVVYKTGLMNSIWALVLPGAVNVYNLLLMINYFRSIPQEMDEAARIDGAGHWRMLFSVYLPLSKTVIATITLFNFVTHWNSWFDGMIYMNSAKNYPLQTYLHGLVIDTQTSFLYAGNLKNADLLNDKNIKAAQIVLASIPVLIVYPWLQRYFTKGIMVGSVKG